jgi:hypothetical protein
MGYTPTTDFLALLRNTGGGVRTEQMPGLDWVVAALARAGFITLSVSATAPTSNQAATAWFQPASPSWTAEGVLFLWNATTSTYQPATPALWSAYFLPVISGYTFQSVNAANASITAGVTLAAVQRAAPAATALILPTLAAQFASGKKLQIVDFSTTVVNHVITLTVPELVAPPTIMGQASQQLLSTAAQLAGIMLQPSPDLNAWVIAP